MSATLGQLEKGNDRFKEILGIEQLLIISLQCPLTLIVILLHVLIRTCYTDLQFVKLCAVGDVPLHHNLSTSDRPCVLAIRAEGT